MFIRMPVQGPLANSTARFALVLRSERGHRVVEFGNRTVTALILLSALLLAWYLFATLYLVFRDDIARAYLGNDRRDTYAYENRILELRSRIDRITARQLLNQETIEDRVSSLVARQAEIEARQALVADLGARAESAGIALPALLSAKSEPVHTGASALSLVQTPARSKPQPIPAPQSAGKDDSRKTAPPRIGMTLPHNGSIRPAMPRGPMEGIVAEVESRSDAMKRAQIAFVSKLGGVADKEIALSLSAVAALGIDPARFGKTTFEVGSVRPAGTSAPRFEGFMLRDVNTEGTAMGGPLLPPIPAREEADRFNHAVSAAEAAIASVRKARLVLKALPIGRPLGSSYSLSSGFGSRLDPFTRSLAQHSGLDFRAPSGTPVRAVAAGKVIEAGHVGGYGRMIEIDHGYGITTRYAHLSSIALSEGDKIEKGTIIGKVGSTGRSTGPHLHYEVRIDDDARDPMRFVKAENLIEQLRDKN